VGEVAGSNPVVPTIRIIFLLIPSEMNKFEAIFARDPIMERGDAGQLLNLGKSRILVDEVEQTSVRVNVTRIFLL
jgi:hypothetical protein